MKSVANKSILVILVLIIALCSLSGCVSDYLPHIHIFKQKMNADGHFMECSCGENKDQAEHTFVWRNDYLHMECTDCGYIIENNIETVIEKNEDGTVRLSENLRSALSDYYKSYFLNVDPYPFNFGEKLNHIKSGECAPVFVKFSSRCYYVAAYFSTTEEHDELYCCSDSYTWVGFEKAEDVKETLDGEILMGAFQINPQEFCVNIKTGEYDVTMDHFVFYRPEFVDGVALAPEITFENLFIYLSQDDDKYICYSSTRYTSLHEAGSFKCMELDGKYYIAEYHGSLYNGADLEAEYGEYYNKLMSILVDEYVVEGDDKRTKYGLFEVEDILEMIK